MCPRSVCQSSYKPQFLQLINRQHASNLLCLYAILHIVSAQSKNVCSSGFYKDLAALSTYLPAQSYCSAKYPPQTLTVTVKQTTVTKRDGNDKGTSSKIGSTKSSKTGTGTNPNWSKVVQQASAVVRTFCSYILSTLTSTVFSTPPTTTTTTTVSYGLASQEIFRYNSECPFGPIHGKTATQGICLGLGEYNAGYQAQTVANAMPNACYLLIFYEDGTCLTSVTVINARSYAGQCYRPDYVQGVILGATPNAAGVCS